MQSKTALMRSVKKLKSNSLERLIYLENGENFADNLYKIVLTGEIPETLDIDKNEIAERLKSVTYFAKVYDETSIKFDLQKIKNEVTLRGIFVKNMLEKIASDKENKTIYERALKIGLKAFEKEVNFDED